MSNSESSVVNPSEPVNLSKNSAYNLFGYGIPILVAVLVFPTLIYNLGEEKFGLLSIIWIFIGYSSFFDFGVGRAMTQIVSEKLGQKKSEEVSTIFWNSILLTLGFGIVGMIVILIFNSFIVSEIFNISDNLKQESIFSFTALAFSIPIVATTAGLRGFLEAHYKFGVINILRTILGTLSFLLPLICSIYFQSFFSIVLSLVVIRVLIWFFYFRECNKLGMRLESLRKSKFEHWKHILRLSGWITISNLIIPFMIYIDRLLIGALDSTSSLTYYSTPYEIVTKFLLIPGAITAVLFPAFSSSYINNRSFTNKLFKDSIQIILMIIYPIVFVTITFSNEIISIWLGKVFADKSAMVLQLLALGVLFNSLAFIPFTYLQGIRRPDIPALINLIELPAYIFLLWFSIIHYGISGAAFVWMMRMIVDTIVHFYFAQKQISGIDNRKDFRNHLASIFYVLLLVIPFLLNNVYLKIGFLTIVLFSFYIISWYFILAPETKNSFKQKFEKYFGYKNSGKNI